jgi:hypothetical protein
LVTAWDTYIEPPYPPILPFYTKNTKNTKKINTTNNIINSKLPMSLKLTNKPPNKKAIRLAKKLTDKTNNLQEIIDATIMLTIFIHTWVKNEEGVEATKQFMDNWLEMVKQNVEEIVFDHELNTRTTTTN